MSEKKPQASCHVYASLFILVSTKNKQKQKPLTIQFHKSVCVCVSALEKKKPEYIRTISYAVMHTVYIVYGWMTNHSIIMEAIVKSIGIWGWSLIVYITQERKMCLLLETKSGEEKKCSQKPGDGCKVDFINGENGDYYIDS